MTESNFNLTFSGCGFLGIYHLGVVSCMKDNAPSFLAKVKCFGGASAGSFASTALLMDLNIAESSEFVLRLAKRARTLTLGPLHPNFRILQTLRRSFEKILPENAHELASGRLHISLTRVSDFTNLIVSEFHSKEDLIEALMASSHVPFYSGILPAKFRGTYYIDGGLSDNLPQHFTEGETITVSPFSGESDICPNDGSPNFAHFDIRNTSVQFTLQNLYRCSRAFFPPEAEVLVEMCKQGYRDTMRFLQTHYPETLTKESRRKTISCSMPGLPPSGLDQTNNQPAELQRRLSSSSLSAYSTCSGGEAEVFLATDSANDADDEVDENESRLVMLLHATSDAVTEAELWSCYFIRRVMVVFKLAAQPCVFTMKQITHMVHIIVESLPMIEKTGLAFLDQLLAMIYMVVHTYKDKHKVQCRGRGMVPSPKRRRMHQMPYNSSLPSIKKDETDLRRINSNQTTTSFATCNTSLHSSSSDITSSDDSDIEIIHDRNFSSTESFVWCSRDFPMLASVTSVHDSPDELQHELGQWESEGGACHLGCHSNDVSDEYVVLDGYESDIESDYETSLELELA